MVLYTKADISNVDLIVPAVEGSDAVCLAN